MENSIFQKIKLGIFVITGVLLFVAGVYFIGSKQSMFGNTDTLYVTFANINGLKSGNNVRYSGINVGTVKEITMIHDTLIIVRVSIEKDIMQHIRKDATAVIATDGLVGSMIINIKPGSASYNKILPNDTITSFSKIGTDEMINTLSLTNENIALITAELLIITREISSGHGAIGALIKDPVIKNDILAITNNVKLTTKSSHETVKALQSLIVSLDQKNNMIDLIKDTVLSNKIRNLVTNIDDSSKGIKIAFQGLNTLIQNSNATITNIKDGKGALNYLSNDPKLVNDIEKSFVKLDSAMYQIHQASIKLNESLDAIQKSWPIRLFIKNE